MYLIRKSNDQQGFFGSIVTLEWLCELIELVAAGSSGWCDVVVANWPNWLSQDLPILIENGAVVRGGCAVCTAPKPWLPDTVTGGCTGRQNPSKSRLAIFSQWFLFNVYDRFELVLEENLHKNPNRTLLFLPSKLKWIWNNLTSGGERGQQWQETWVTEGYRARPGGSCPSNLEAEAGRGRFIVRSSCDDLRCRIREPESEQAKD